MAKHPTRRQFLGDTGKVLGSIAASALLPASIRKALAIPAARRAGTIEDVQHIVVLMMENRSFDHYFGTMAGVRGFADRFPIPLEPLAQSSDRLADPGDRVVWQQWQSGGSSPSIVTPYRLDTQDDFKTMRVTGAPHVWSNALDAWGQGRIQSWPTFKHSHAMTHYGQADLPFQFALANAFTIADAYHCSFQGGTNPNRVFLFTGTVDSGVPGDGGPVIGNLYNNLQGGDPNGGYRWTTYPERLEANGISWAVYQNMEVDNFELNPLAGFAQFRDAYHGRQGADPNLKSKALSTRDLDQLRQDVIDDRLPQVCWVCPTALGSEHPGPSSPAQGAQYTAAVLDALTANPAVWASTVLLLMFDENDGFFDHMPPPAVPSILIFAAQLKDSQFAGASTVDTLAEYHQRKSSEADDTEAYMYSPYGLGPRVPLYAISPWSKGGWVNSQVFDHTSVIRFIEARFAVVEPNISAWRRAVCGDLTSLFDFAHPQGGDVVRLPATGDLARRAAQLPRTFTPAVPASPHRPIQPQGVRPSRALPYQLKVQCEVRLQAVALAMINEGQAGAVFHVYDKKALAQGPRRYTVEAGKSLTGQWALDGTGHYDLWVLGPNGFHRCFRGARDDRFVETQLIYLPKSREVRLVLENQSTVRQGLQLLKSVYGDAMSEIEVDAGQRREVIYSLQASRLWYDVSIVLMDRPGYLRRYAGRMENGEHLTSDPAMFGPMLLSD